jgi:hypothetical protein
MTTYTNIYYTVNTFQNNSTITAVDCNYCEWEANTLRMAFYNCQNLRTVTRLNDDISYMYKSFENCTQLESMPKIPSMVTDITYGFRYCSNLKIAQGFNDRLRNMRCTFQGCSNLTSCSNLPDTVENGAYAFNGCTNLTIVPELGNSLTNAIHMFQGCQKLKQYPSKLPDTLIGIDYMFGQCVNLTTSVTIPSSVQNMAGMYDGCVNITVASGMSNATSVHNSKWSYWNCTGIREIEDLPPNVSEIDGMFSGCSNLTTINVNIPTNVTTADKLFAGCSNLGGDIVFESTEIQTASGCFEGTSLEKNVYIPFTYENGAHTLTYNTFTNIFPVDGGVMGSVYGTLTNDNGKFTGWSANNYITATWDNEGETQELIFYIKIDFPTTYPVNWSSILSFGNNRTLFSHQAHNTLALNYGGSGDLMIPNQDFRGKTLWFKLAITVDGITLSAQEDNGYTIENKDVWDRPENWASATASVSGNYMSSFNVNTTHLFCFGKNYEWTATPYCGSIYIYDSFVYVNGNKAWQGFGKPCGVALKDITTLE